MTYAVKEIFYTLQGEGQQAGRAAVFCRFAGCNLWSGREEDRALAACRFGSPACGGPAGVGGGGLARAVGGAGAGAATWAGTGGDRFVVFTGGEPLLQLDDALLAAMHGHGFTCAVETNGTQEAPAGLDWICVSPKAGVPLTLTGGDEIKLVYPQEGLEPSRVAALPFRHFWLQPMDGAAREANTQAAVAYCLAHPRWRLSLQTHKVIGIP